MPQYLYSRDWLDMVNRLWWLDQGGTLPPAGVMRLLYCHVCKRAHEARACFPRYHEPIIYAEIQPRRALASTPAEHRAVADLMPALARTSCTCAKCQPRRA